MQEAVASRTWRSVEAKRAAFDMARAVDVMAESGLKVEEEPACEVLLRAVAAGWFADRHPAEGETSEWLKESSMAHFGVPRGLLEEARTMRKLQAKATSAGGKAMPAVCHNAKRRGSCVRARTVDKGSTGWRSLPPISHLRRATPVFATALF